MRLTDEGNQNEFLTLFLNMSSSFKPRAVMSNQSFLTVIHQVTSLLVQCQLTTLHNYLDLPVKSDHDEFIDGEFLTPLSTRKGIAEKGIEFEEDEDPEEKLTEEDKSDFSIKANKMHLIKGTAVKNNVNVHETTIQKFLGSGAMVEENKVGFGQQVDVEVSDPFADVTLKDISLAITKEAIAEEVNPENDDGKVKARFPVPSERVLSINMAAECYSKPFKHFMDQLESSSDQVRKTITTRLERLSKSEELSPFQKTILSIASATKTSKPKPSSHSGGLFGGHSSMVVEDSNTRVDWGEHEDITFFNYNVGIIGDLNEEELERNLTNLRELVSCDSSADQ